MNPMLTLIRSALVAAGRPGARLASLTSIFTRFAIGPCRAPVPVPIPRRRPRPVARVLFAAFAASVALAGVASAATWYRPADVDYNADGRLVDVQILVSGRAAPLFVTDNADGRRYFQAFKGRNYAVAVQNNSPNRIGVLIAVDGLNVVNGERSALDSNEPMYVLGPYERAVIRGWRTSLRDVRQFVFVDEQRSYAERTGQANGDMGWIRVLAFREFLPAWRWREDQKIRDRDQVGEILPAPRPFPMQQPREGLNGAEPRADQAPRSEQAPQATAPQAKAPQAQGAQPEWGRGMAGYRDNGVSSPTPSFPGTGWGDRKYDAVREVEFTAERVPMDRMTFRYEYASGLRALGIFPQRDRLWDRERGELGFARPPQW